LNALIDVRFFIVSGSWFHRAVAVGKNELWLSVFSVPSW